MSTDDQKRIHELIRTRDQVLELHRFQTALFAAMGAEEKRFIQAGKLRSDFCREYDLNSGQVTKMMRKDLAVCSGGMFDNLAAFVTADILDNIRRIVTPGEGGLTQPTLQGLSVLKSEVISLGFEVCIAHARHGSELTYRQFADMFPDQPKYLHQTVVDVLNFVKNGFVRLSKPAVEGDPGIMEDVITTIRDPDFHDFVRQAIVENADEAARLKVRLREVDASLVPYFGAKSELFVALGVSPTTYRDALGKNDRAGLITLRDVLAKAEAELERRQSGTVKPAVQPPPEPLPLHQPPVRERTRPVPAAPQPAKLASVVEPPSEVAPTPKHAGTPDNMLLIDHLYGQIRRVSGEALQVTVLLGRLFAGHMELVSRLPDGERRRVLQRPEMADMMTYVHTTMIEAKEGSDHPLAIGAREQRKLLGFNKNNKDKG